MCVCVYKYTHIYICMHIHSCTRARTHNFTVFNFCCQYMDRNWGWASTETWLIKGVPILKLTLFP